MALTKYQRYRYMEIPRSQIQTATYNPRDITDESAKKLSRNLEQRGLLTTLVWNQRTGVLVGGHQRLKALDDLNGHDAYMVGVAAIDVDEKTERELNVFLNNTHAQGEFDPDALVQMFANGVDVEAAGFSGEELLLEFGAREDLARVVERLPHRPDRRKWDQFYGSSRWQTLRANYMAEHPYCEECQLRGRGDVVATECDHVVPHRFREELMWDIKNLRALCETCHKAKTWRDRRAPPLGWHVLAVFRSADDKYAFLRHLGREPTLRRMMADELIDYVRPEAKWRDTSIEDAFKEARKRFPQEA